MFDEGDDEALLLALFDEVIYVIDVFDAVPASIVLIRLKTAASSGHGSAPLSAMEVHGSPPKGVSLSELSVARDEHGWRCRATIDV